MLIFVSLFNPWILVAAIGGWCNILVMYTNGGKMPVFKANIEIESRFHCSGDSETKFPWLGDWICLGNWLWSPGDILMVLGLLLGFVSFIRRIFQC